MAVELATAYVSLVVDTKDLPAQVKAGFTKTTGIAKSAGQGMGSEMSKGVGETLKTGIGSAIDGIPFSGLLTGALNRGALGGTVAAAAAVGGTIATALTKGFERLTAIDDARGKLAGLGHSAQETSSIMGSALSAVKGTSYGLGEAATIAASAVAAGVKPGQDLTRYLKLIADSSAVAGTNLGDMGYIINEVQTGQRAYTRELNEFSTRGVPIFKWLQDQYRVSAVQLRKMVEEGKVDSATFLNVIEKNIGGAAVTMGNSTVHGSFNNLKAALGRLGAAAEQPTFDRMKGWLASATGEADKLTPAVGRLATRLDAKIFTEWGPNLKKSFDELKDTEAYQEGIARIETVFEQLARAGHDAFPAIKSIAESLAEASGATGVSTWHLLLAVLESTATIANSTLVPALQTIAGLMHDNQDAVTGLVIAFAVFKTWPSILARLNPAMTTVSGGFGSLRTSLASFRDEMRLQQALAAASGPQIASLGAVYSNTGRQIGALGSVFESAGRQISTQQAFFAASAVKMQAAWSGLKSAGSGLIASLGGPWGLAIGATTGLILANVDSANSAKQAHQALAEAVVNGSKAQGQFFAAVSEANGALSDQAVKAGAEAVKNSLAETLTLGERGHTVVESIGHALDDISFNAFGQNDNWEKDFDKVTGAGERLNALKSAAQDLKLNLEDVYRITATGGPEFDKLTAKLDQSGQAGKDAATALRAARDQLRTAAEQARNSTPGFGTLAVAFRTIADNASTADERLSAMKRALDMLSGKPIDLGNAMQAYNQVIRQTTDSTQSLFDASQGLGQQLINQDGTVNTRTANGDKLRTALIQIRDATLDVAKAGGDLNPVYASNADAFAKLGSQLGLTKEQVQALAASIGYLPDKITMLAELKGAGDVTAQLAVIKSLLEQNKNGIEIPTDALTDETKKKLDQLGIKRDELTGKPGIVRISAPNDEALKAIQAIIDKQIPDKSFNVHGNLILPPGMVAQTQANTGTVPPWQQYYVHQKADGGAISGAGGPTSDSIPAMLSANEHVWTSAEVDSVGGHQAMYGLRSLALAGGLRFARGGTPFGGDTVPVGISDAIKAAQGVEGHPYLKGGVGPDQFDCSGFVGWLQQITMGLDGVSAAGRRLYTTYSLLGGATAGLVPGLGPSGTWFQVGASDEHMAATIAGLPAESGGQWGTSGIGVGRAGALDSQFPNKFHLPNELIAGINSLTTGGHVVTWTRKDEDELQDLIAKLDEAKQKRTKVDNNPKATAADKARADAEVHDAQDKVIDKQRQKDERGTVQGGTRVAPQAPALKRRYTTDEEDRAKAQQAVEEANRKRNEVYDNPASTDADRQVADADLQSAIDKLKHGGKETPKAKSVKDILIGFASSVAGIAFDAFKAQLPSGLGDSHWWGVADQALSLATDYGGAAQNPLQSALSNVGSFGEDVMRQLGYNPDAGLPDWVKKLQAPTPKVFDTGGWLMPGEIGVNLSSTPEPIFNSPAQLRAFAGSLSQPAQGGLTEQDVERIMRLRPEYHLHVSSVNEAMQAVRVEQKRQAMTHYRR